MKGEELFEYGVAINFFGNYKSELSGLTNFFNDFSRSLFSLKSLLIGGGLTAGLSVLANSMFAFGKTLEGYYANIKASVGTQEKTLSVLDYASTKAAETPFSLGEVVNAVSRMTMYGFSKDRATMDKVFGAVGDMAGNRGFDFSHAMDMVAKAGFGNWESLKDMTGLNKTTLATTLKESQQWAAASKEEQNRLSALAKEVQTGTAGTMKYRMALIELIGFLNKGGMEEKVKTVSGVLSNLGDIYERFMTSMIGYSQVEGSFFNNVRKTLTSIYDNFGKASSAFDSLASKADGAMTVQERLGRLAENIGRVLSEVWRWVGTYMEKASVGIIKYLLEIDRYMNDFPNKVAPLILFLYLIKLQIADFFSGFIDGFQKSWGVFWGITKMIIGGLRALYSALTGNGVDAISSIGGALGLLAGAIVGLKVVSVVVGPILTFISVLRSLWGVIGMVSGAWEAFGVLAAVNPVTWIVLAVIALIAGLVALIYYWDEVTAWVKEFFNAFVERYPILGFVFSRLIEGLVVLWDFVKGYFQFLYTIFKTVFNFLYNGIKVVWEYFSKGGSVMKEIGLLLVDMFISPLDLVVRKALEFWGVLKDLWNWVSGEGEDSLNGQSIGVEHTIKGQGNPNGEPFPFQDFNYKAPEVNYKSLYQKPLIGPSQTNTYGAENSFEVNTINVNVTRPTDVSTDVLTRQLLDAKNRRGKQ